MTGFVTVQPPADGLQLAMSTARRRRMRTASVTTSLGASLALAVPLLLGSTGQSSVLLPEPDVKQPAVTTSDQPVVTVPSHVVAAGQPNTAPNTAPGTAPTGSGTARVSVTPAPAAVGRGSTATVSTPGPSTPYAAGSMTRSDNYIQVPDASCSYYDGRAHPTGLCPSAFNVSKSQDGTYDLTSYVCNEDASDADLVFQTTNEVDFAIGKGRTELWRWSRWHAPRDHRHNLRITPGSCTNWDFTWTGVDASGEPLKPGDYDLTVSFLTDPLKTRSITVTVTVS